MSTDKMDNSLLPFLRGADFSHNDFEADKFLTRLELMKSLEWLTICRTKLNWIPEDFAHLEALEKLNLSHNQLASLHGELVCLKKLRFLSCRHNRIHATDIPDDLFNITTLSILDLSHNNLTVIPKNLENCKSLAVLNLSHNNIRNLSESLFINLTNLLHLDLSDNELKTLPPQLGRLTNLKTLILNNNPFEEHKMRLIERLKSLQVLQMVNTNRNIQNMPTNMDELANMVELNLSSNKLTKVPDDLVRLKHLNRLNLSENQIEKLPNDFGSWWPSLRVLNISGNRLVEVPTSLCKLCNLRKLYVNDNQLTFQGLPAALGKLHQLEIFMAARNNLESIPESIFRCGRLKKLILTSNKLLTLPETIHLLYDLETLELSNNPNLVMPPRPINESSKNPEFYNIDFSLDTQKRLAGDPELAKLPIQSANELKDPIARKLRLRTRAKEDNVEQETNQAKVLKGMQDIVNDRDILETAQLNLTELDLKPKRWDENLEKPPIDYSEFFDETTGQIQGLTIWEIENFRPVLMDANLYGKLYDEDCYIILSTQIDDNMSLNWKIFYWIGSRCTLDKKACSAIHAVSLRNHLNAQCRTIREEQGEESDEFLALFPDGVDHVRGARTASGFYIVDETTYTHRMYRMHELANKSRQLHLQTIRYTSSSLDSRFVFLIDAGLTIFIWNGNKAKNTIRQKARLIGEKLNKEERKCKAELVLCDQGDEPKELLDELQMTEPLSKTLNIVGSDLIHDPIEDYKPIRPILYQVDLSSCLELRQVHFRFGKLHASYLKSNCVYIMDCFTDVFIWAGRKSSKVTKLGGIRITEDLFNMIRRPDFASISYFPQGNEPQLFKSKFFDWDDVIAVDYTRTAESVSKTGADLTKWMSGQNVKTDLSVLFTPRAVGPTEEEAEMMMQCWNDELDYMEIFILEKGKRFSKIPEHEFGNFFSDESYVIMCRYIVPFDDDLTESSSHKENENRPQNGVAHDQVNGGEDGSSDAPSLDEHDFRCVVYFWQGRGASPMGWLNFTFGLQKKFEARFGSKLEVVKINQQQESTRFLSHFWRKFVIHQGKRSLSSSDKPVQLYQLRSNTDPLTLRCIEIQPSASKLNSGFPFIICLNNNNNQPLYQVNIISQDIGTNAVNKIYVWLGSKAKASESKIAEQIAREKFSSNQTNIAIIHEGQEPDEIYKSLGGRQDYDKDSSYMNYLRLFKCSNDKGYFCISEEKIDFSQESLSDDDIMILDNGSQVFLWIGPKSSDIEVRLAYKSAEVYVKDLAKKEGKSRQLMLTLKGKESKKFTKCFHAWSEHKVIKDPRGDESRFLKFH